MRVIFKRVKHYLHAFQNQPLVALSDDNIKNGQAENFRLWLNRRGGVNSLNYNLENDWQDLIGVSSETHYA